MNNGIPLDLTSDTKECPRCGATMYRPDSSPKPKWHECPNYQNVIDEETPLIFHLQGGNNDE